MAESGLSVVRRCEMAQPMLRQAELIKSGPASTVAAGSLLGFFADLEPIVTPLPASCGSKHEEDVQDADDANDA
jgi:hypothetical protein